MVGLAMTCLRGGSAKTYCLFAAGFGQDIITDFEDGLDKL